MQIGSYFPETNHEVHKQYNLNQVLQVKLMLPFVQQFQDLGIRHLPQSQYRMYISLGNIVHGTQHSFQVPFHTYIPKGQTHLGRNLLCLYKPYDNSFHPKFDNLHLCHTHMSSYDEMTFGKIGDFRPCQCNLQLTSVLFYSKFDLISC